MSDRLAIDDRAGASAEQGETWGSTTSEPLSGGCHAGAAEMPQGSRERRQVRGAGALRRRLPQGSARSAAKHVPGVRFPAGRPTDAPNGDGALGSACCVYGLTFTSHFYGARRTVGYVPFNSETLVTGKLFEDIRDAVFELADPALYDTVIVTNLCVPTASGVPLQLLPKEINGVRIIGIDVPGFGVPTHAEAKDVLAGAMLKYARGEAEQGPVAAPREVSDKPTITLLGEMFPVDPVGIGMMLEPLGLAAGPVVPTREWRELYAALDCAAVAAIHPFYTASVREFVAAGRSVVGSAPVGHDGTAAWLDAIGRTCGIAQDKIDASKNRFLPMIRSALAAAPIKGRITLSGYEGSELLVARLLIESGADVPYVGTACPQDAVVRPRSRVARGARRTGPVPRLAGAGHRGVRGIRARSGHRHHAGRAARQATPGARALLHQSDLGAAPHGTGGRGVFGPGHQWRASPTRAVSTSMSEFFDGVGTGHASRRLGRHAGRPP